MRLAVSHTIAESHLPYELVAYQAGGRHSPPVELHDRQLAHRPAARRRGPGRHRDHRGSIRSTPNTTGSNGSSSSTTRS